MRELAREVSSPTLRVLVWVKSHSTLQSCPAASGARADVIAISMVVSTRPEAWVTLSHVGGSQPEPQMGSGCGPAAYMVGPLDAAAAASLRAETARA